MYRAKRPAADERNFRNLGRRDRVCRLKPAARFEQRGEKRAMVSGSLVFSTVAALLPAGSAAIRSGETQSIDLGGVEAGDSAGLALLIEWLSVAREASQALVYTHVPAQLHQLAALSEVDNLLSGVAAARAT